MTQSLVLAIDTSAYTTSVALMSIEGCLLRDERSLLRVEQGQRGLRQAEALFQHVRNLPVVMESVFSDLEPFRLAAVSATSSPRPVAGSYMPVFLPGVSVARSVAASLSIPFWTVSHQEGHIFAALWSLADGNPSTGPEDSLLAVHLSGGTTEAVLVNGIGQEHRNRPSIELVGTTGDISAGQFVDRVGTALGLPFPAGPSLDALAGQGEMGRVRLPCAVQGDKLSFSGPESAAYRALAAGAKPADVARGVFDCLAKSLEAWLVAVSRRTAVSHILLAGGVMSSSTLRCLLGASPVLSHLRLSFASPEFSSDNAVGVAAWAAARCSECPIAALPKRFRSLMSTWDY